MLDSILKYLEKRRERKHQMRLELQEEKRKTLKVEQEIAQKERDRKAAEDKMYGPWTFFKTENRRTRERMSADVTSVAAVLTTWDTFVRYHKVTGEPQFMKRNEMRSYPKESFWEC